MLYFQENNNRNCAYYFQRQFWDIAEQTKQKTQAVIKKVHSPKALSMKRRLNVIVYT